MGLIIACFSESSVFKVFERISVKFLVRIFKVFDVCFSSAANVLSMFNSFLTVRQQRKVSLNKESVVARRGLSESLI